MGFIRKIIALILTVIFAAALVVCAGIVFAVKNVNVTFKDYTGKYAEALTLVEDELEKYKGLYIFSINGDDIEESVKNLNLDCYVSLVSVERIYPCTVNVVLKERIERYAIYKDNAYLVYDTDGEYVRTTAENKNNADLAPNVLVDGAKTEEEIKFISQIGTLIESKFNNVRMVVEKINYPIDADSEFPKAEVVLRSGLIIEIVKPTNYLSEKINAAYDLYLSLSDSQKLAGKIRSYEYSSSVVDVRAVYSA
ncbi:MAG: hypothetical protein J6B04_00180 [Clostridia bacterium]|nr:hypothetical protein [Clostridia bacterium]